LPLRAWRSASDFGTLVGGRRYRCSGCGCPRDRQRQQQQQIAWHQSSSRRVLRYRSLLRFVTVEHAAGGVPAELELQIVCGEL